MRYLPVHWSEGMFLRPQHFQAADRHWNELIRTSQRWDSYYNHGVQSIEISTEALTNYQVEITSCHARMRDGTLVVLDAGNEPDRVGLKEAFKNESEVLVYLAIPKLSLGRPNARPPADQAINGTRPRHCQSPTKPPVATIKKSVSVRTTSG